MPADSRPLITAPGSSPTFVSGNPNFAVYDAIRRVKEGRFTGGIYNFGLAEDGVGYVYDEHNRALIPDAVHARVEALKAEIVAGRIVVPASR